MNEQTQELVAYTMLLSIADSILETHVAWCGAPLSPTYPAHNFACRCAAERSDLETKPL
jgi:hypothetical protein